MSSHEGREFDRVVLDLRVGEHEENKPKQIIDRYQSLFNKFNIPSGVWSPEQTKRLIRADVIHLLTNIYSDMVRKVLGECPANEFEILVDNLTDRLFYRIIEILIISLENLDESRPFAERISARLSSLNILTVGVIDSLLPHILETLRIKNELADLTVNEKYFIAEKKRLLRLLSIDESDESLNESDFIPIDYRVGLIFEDEESDFTYNNEVFVAYKSLATDIVKDFLTEPARRELFDAVDISVLSDRLARDFSKMSVESLYDYVVQNYNITSERDLTEISDETMKKVKYVVKLSLKILIEGITKVILSEIQERMLAHLGSTQTLESLLNLTKDLSGLQSRESESTFEEKSDKRLFDVIFHHLPPAFRNQRNLGVVGISIPEIEEQEFSTEEQEKYYKMETNSFLSRLYLFLRREFGPDIFIEPYGKFQFRVVTSFSDPETLCKIAFKLQEDFYKWTKTIPLEDFRYAKPAISVSSFDKRHYNTFLNRCPKSTVNSFLEYIVAPILIQKNKTGIDNFKNPERELDSISFMGSSLSPDEFQQHGLKGISSITNLDIQNSLQSALKSWIEGSDRSVDLAKLILFFNDFIRGAYLITVLKRLHRQNGKKKIDIDEIVNTAMGIVRENDTDIDTELKVGSIDIGFDGVHVIESYAPVDSKDPDKTHIMTEEAINKRRGAGTLKFDVESLPQDLKGALFDPTQKVTFFHFGPYDENKSLPEVTSFSFGQSEKTPRQRTIDVNKRLGAKGQNLPFFDLAKHDPTRKETRIVRPSDPNLNPTGNSPSFPPRGKNE